VPVPAISIVKDRESPATLTQARIAREPGRPTLPGEALTRRAVTAITAAIVVMTFAFSLGNVTNFAKASASPPVSPG
jgi:hypothetical protein